MGLRQHRRRWRIARPQLAAASRPACRRHVDDQRDHRCARRAVRLRSLGRDGEQRLGLGGFAALVHRHRKRRQFRRPADPRPQWADRHPALQTAELGAGQPRDVRRLCRTRCARGARPERPRRPCRRHRADAAQPLQGSPPRHARDIFALRPLAAQSHHPRRKPCRSCRFRRRPRQRRRLSRPRERAADRDRRTRS